MGRLWKVSGAVLGSFGALLGAPWGPLGLLRPYAGHPKVSEANQKRKGEIFKHLRFSFGCWWILAFWSLLGNLFEPLRNLLKPLGGVVELCFLASCKSLGSLSGLSWVLSQAYWGQLGSSRWLRGLPYGALGLHDALGTHLEDSGESLGPSCEALERSWGRLGALCGSP